MVVPPSSIGITSSASSGWTGTADPAGNPDAGGNPGSAGNPDPAAVDPSDVQMLQDLVVAAVNDALGASRRLAEDKMAAVTGGLRLPGF